VSFKTYMSYHATLYNVNQHNTTKHNKIQNNSFLVDNFLSVGVGRCRSVSVRGLLGRFSFYASAARHGAGVRFRGTCRAMCSIYVSFVNLFPCISVP